MSLIFLKFYLFNLEIERAHAQVGGGAEEEGKRGAQADYALSTEPNIGLYLITLSSWPMLKLTIGLIQAPQVFLSFLNLILFLIYKILTWFQIKNYKTMYI